MDVAGTNHATSSSAKRARITAPTLTRVLTLALVASTACSSSTEWRRKKQRDYEEEQARLVERPNKPTNAKQQPRRRRRRRITDPEAKKLDRLAKQLGARPLPIDNPCNNPLCTSRALDPLFKGFDRAQKERDGRVRITHLGDSHIAADYITRTIRDRLQARFGNGGRGFVAIDQRARYGGRRLKREGWERTRIVDKGQRGRPFGFAGMAIHSERRGALVSFELEPEDDDVVVYYQAERRGGSLDVFVEAERVGGMTTKARNTASSTKRFEIPEHRLGGATPPEWMRIVTRGRGPTIMGLSFESIERGLIYDSIGPVGADASVYLSLDKESLRDHIKAANPDMVVLMIGGNDALAIRQGKRTMAQVRKQHVRLVRRLKKYRPNAACMFFGPMDAAERLSDGTIVTKEFIPEIRDMQRDVAKEEGCAFWDAFEAMGGPGSFGVWLKAGIMNKDLIHPRAKGGDLLGHLFARSLMAAYLDQQ